MSDELHGAESHVELQSTEPARPAGFAARLRRGARGRGGIGRTRGDRDGTSAARGRRVGRSRPDPVRDDGTGTAPAAAGRRADRGRRARRAAGRRHARGRARCSGTAARVRSRPRARCANSPMRCRTRTRSRRPTCSRPRRSRSLHGTIDSAEHKAAELQLVQTAGAPLAGVDFDVQGLKLSTAVARRRLRQGDRRSGHVHREHAQGAVLGADAEGAARRRTTTRRSAELRQLAAEHQPADVRRRGAHGWQVVRERGVHRARVHPGVQPTARGRLRFRARARSRRSARRRPMPRCRTRCGRCSSRGLDEALHAWRRRTSCPSTTTAPRSPS